ncbi:FAD-dependent oxidoreductase [Actinopolymorpha sp. B11F2]|uniref:NAD(P)/FAD-dependent oxidoreductase n=1 Tax=Actinopolymorpha sp. B11F2 TaxID=3160862 RepID=UPI0032E503F4
MRIVVVGSGIVGTSVAYHLARRGRDVDVVLVDRGDPGRATDAGAGIICPWLSSAKRYVDAYQLHAAGAAYYPELIEALGDDGETKPSYAKVGGLFVSTDDAALADAHALATRRAAEAPAVGEVTRVDPADVRRYFPPLREDYSGVHVSGGGRVDGRVMRDALVRAAARRGMTRRSGSAQLAVDDTGRITGVRLTGRGSAGDLVPADAVIVAAGAWTPELLRPFGVKLALTPQKGQIVHLQLAGVDTSAWPIVQPLGAHYLLAFPGGRIVCGATRETGSGFDYRLTAGGIREVLDDALTVAPGLADATLLESRVGFRPRSDDEIPFLGRVPGVDGLVVATGMGATGLTAGPYSGRIAAALALDEPSPLDLTPFRIDRP